MVALLCCGYLVPLLTHAQSSCGDVVLRTQAEVDAFDCSSVTSLDIYFDLSSTDPIVDLSSLSSLTMIENSLTVDGDGSSSGLAGLDNLETIGNDFNFSLNNVSDFKGLGSLRSIQGSLNVTQADITNFEGLEGLESIGGQFFVAECYSLENFVGLDSLRSIAGVMNIDRVDEISFNGLNALTSVGGLISDDSYVSIDNFIGLESLKIIRGQLSLGNTDMGVASLKGLEALEEVTGDILLTYAGIENLQGLNNLQRIGGEMSVRNTSLKSLDGLESLEEVGSITIIDNYDLSECCAIMSLPQRVQDKVSIENNAPRCNTLDEVKTVCAEGANGVFYSYYEGNLESVDDLGNYPNRFVTSSTLPNFSINAAQQEDYFGFEFSTYIDITTAGEYTFYTNSDDGSKLYINGDLLVSNDGIRPPVEKSGTVTLSPGKHQLEVLYFEAFGGQKLEVSYAGPGISKQLIPDEVLFLNGDTPALASCGDVVLSTQAEVDAFNCTSVKSLTIDPSLSTDPITDLGSLSSLTVVENHLNIIGWEAALLTSLAGLDNLSTIGGDFNFTTDIANLKGLSGLQSIGGSFNASYTDITNFEGLENLETIGGSFDVSHASITNFVGLENLETIGGEFSLEFTSPVVDFTGLGNLKSIVGPLVLDQTDNISFNGLERLVSVGGINTPDSYVIIDDFIGLESLKIIRGNLYLGGTDMVVASVKGLEALEEVTGNIDFSYTGFEDLQGLNNLRRVGGKFRIENNGLLKSINELEALQEVGEGIVVLDNYSLSECCILTSLANVITSDILVEDNDVSCESLDQVQEVCREGANGVVYRYYEDNSLSSVDDLESYQVTDSGIQPNFSISSAQQEDYFGFEFSTYIDITTAGEYTFYTNSDDGSKLYINGDLLVSNDGIRPPVEKSGTVTLSPGKHQLEVLYFEAFGGQKLEVSYAGPGISKQLIPDEVLFLQGDEVAREYWLEAECASVGDYWKSVNASSASGSYLQATVQGAGPDNLPREDSRRQIAFTVETSQAGTYQIFARQRADNSRDNSFFFQVNDGDWQVWSTSVTRRFGWSSVVNGSYQLNEGVNTIRFANRESGARLDKIYVTQTSEQPTDFGEEASNCGGDARLADSTFKTDFLEATTAELVTYPNPANGELTVQIPGTEALSGELVIADLSGRRVQRSIPTEVSGRTYQLDIRALPAGIYLLQWQADRLYTARVLVER